MSIPQLKSQDIYDAFISSKKSTKNMADFYFNKHLEKILNNQEETNQDLNYWINKSIRLENTVNFIKELKSTTPSKISSLYENNKETIFNFDELDIKEINELLIILKKSEYLQDSFYKNMLKHFNGDKFPQLTFDEYTSYFSQLPITINLDKCLEFFDFALQDKKHDHKYLILLNNKLLRNIFNNFESIIEQSFLNIKSNPSCASNEYEKIFFYTYYLFSPKYYSYEKNYVGKFFPINSETQCNYFISYDEDSNDLTLNKIFQIKNIVDKYPEFKKDLYYHVPSIMLLIGEKNLDLVTDVLNNQYEVFFKANTTDHYGSSAIDLFNKEYYERTMWQEFFKKIKTDDFYSFSKENQQSLLENPLIYYSSIKFKSKKSYTKTFLANIFSGKEDKHLVSLALLRNTSKNFDSIEKGLSFFDIKNLTSMDINKAQKFSQKLLSISDPYIYSTKKTERVLEENRQQELINYIENPDKNLEDLKKLMLIDSRLISTLFSTVRKIEQNLNNILGVQTETFTLKSSMTSIPDYSPISRFDFENSNFKDQNNILFKRYKEIFDFIIDINVIYQKSSFASILRELSYSDSSLETLLCKLNLLPKFITKTENLFNKFTENVELLAPLQVPFAQIENKQQRIAELSHVTVSGYQNFKFLTKISNSTISDNFFSKTKNSTSKNFSAPKFSNIGYCRFFLFSNSYRHILPTSSQHETNTFKVWQDCFEMISRNNRLFEELSQNDCENQQIHLPYRKNKI